MSRIPRPSIASLDAAHAELARLLDASRENGLPDAPGGEASRTRAALLMRQATAVLSMLELHDAAQLARDLSLALDRRDMRSALRDAIEAAGVVLSRYPGYVRERREARPELLRPEHNALRRQLGLEALPEASFLLEDDFRHCHHPPRGATPCTSEQLPRRLRHLYQLGLLAVVRGRFDPVHVHMMRRACERMLELAGGGEAGERWWLLGGVLEGLANHALRATPERIRTLRTADAWMRDCVHDRDRSGDPLAPEQRRTLLSLIARAGPGQRVAEIRALYDLGLMLPDDQTLARERLRLLGKPDADLADTMGIVQTAFGAMRRVLAELAPEAPVPAGMLAGMPTSMAQAVQGLGDCGLDEAAARLEAIRTPIGERIDTGRDVGIDMLQELANVVVEAEFMLSGLAREHGIEIPRDLSTCSADIHEQARHGALAQARDCLDGVKREFSMSIDSGAPQRLSSTARQLLAMIHGALLMLGHRDAATIAARLVASAEAGRETASATAESAHVTHLADLLIGLEYCIASLQAGDQPDGHILELTRSPDSGHDGPFRDEPASVGMC